MNTSIYLQLISLNKTYNNHFLKRYVKLVSFFKERNFKKKKFLHHEHHILPESFGGLDTKENLVFITIREHFILHHLLYKAFPNSSMVTAFHMMCHCWGKYFRITSKVYENAMIESGKNQSEMLKKLVAEGRHHFQDKEKARERANKRVAEGRHNFSGPENNLKRVEEGNHPFSGPENNLKRVEEGNHPFSGPESNKKQLENGNHPSQIKKLCPHCKQEFSLGPFSNFHGHKCKLNPLFKKEKIECEHCKREFDIRNFSRWHGDKCKLKPM